MGDETPMTTITTSDRCPACGRVEIAQRDGASPVESVQAWSCLRCGFAFYRYRGDEGGDAEAGRRRPPPIG